MAVSAPMLHWSKSMVPTPGITAICCHSSNWKAEAYPRTGAGFSKTTGTPASMAVRKAAAAMSMKKFPSLRSFRSASVSSSRGRPYGASKERSGRGPGCLSLAREKVEHGGPMTMNRKSRHLMRTRSRVHTSSRERSCSDPLTMSKSSHAHPLAANMALSPSGRVLGPLKRCRASGPYAWGCRFCAGCWTPPAGFVGGAA